MGRPFRPGLDEGRHVARDAATLYHAWIGVKDIWMDYVKPMWLRLSLQTLTALWLFACAFWSIFILWRV
jgi:succinate dehydrogenase / fumarate reductase, membrane anchor subunit